MFAGPIKALFSLKFYTEYIQKSGWKALLFVLYLFVISAVVMGIFAFNVSKQPANDIITKVAEYTPEMVFKDGRVTVNNDQPLTIQPAELNGYKIVFETGRTEPVFPTQMRTDNIFLLVTGDTVYTSFQGKFETSEIPDDINMTIDSAIIDQYRPAAVTFILYFLTSITVLLQLIKLPFMIFMAFIVALLMNSFSHANLGPAKLLKLACYTQAPVTLLAILNFVSPVKIPLIIFVYLITFGVYSQLVISNILKLSAVEGTEEKPESEEKKEDDTEDKKEI